jgi:uncharacterized protein YbcI
MERISSWRVVGGTLGWIGSSFERSVARQASPQLFLSGSTSKEGRREVLAMAQAPTQGKQALAAISEALVTLHREYYGKGPTKAKTFLVNDTVLCLLKGGFTVVEKTLIANGRQKAVHDIRHSFQEAMEVQFTNVVQDALGRTVIAYMSTVHNDPDISAELFVLEPMQDGPPVSALEHDVQLDGAGTH